MGSLCSCLQGDDMENQPSREGDGQAASTINEAAAARTTTASATDDAFFGTYRSPPRPLPYDVNPRSLDCLQGKLIKFTNDERLAEVNTKASSLKLSLSERKVDFGYFYAPTEDEDVCPTCLDEYTPENPKIVTKCFHHYHLVCIYEWMERSDTCPICGKVMMFDETT